MPDASDKQRPDALLATFGLFMVAAAWVALVVQSAITPPLWVTTCALAGYVLAIGAALRGAFERAAPRERDSRTQVSAPLKRDASHEHTSSDAPHKRASDQDKAEAHADGFGGLLAVFEGFERWHAQAPGEPSWSGFDQFVREMLAEQFGAGRVRCYHVCGEANTLEPLSGSDQPIARDGPEVRGGVVGYVLSTGRPFWRGKAGQGPLVEQLAQAATDGIAAAWPIRGEGAVVGLITIGHLPAAPAAGFVRMEIIRRAVQGFWWQVRARAALAHARRTDRPTGVLTRSELFALAEPLLSEAKTNQEPVVAVMVALEGVRALDDRADWDVRDQLLQRIGRSLAAGLRSDDLIGRFADDRFVILLRRMDSGLARLIVKKLLAGVEGQLDASAGENRRVTVRAGLVGTGLRTCTVAELLAGAMDAVRSARQRGVMLASDVDDTARGHA